MAESSILNHLVTNKDIRNTELGSYSVDIAILCLAMWGSNCVEYIQEAHRILDTNGILLVSEPYKRWYDAETQENPLVKLLAKNGFKVNSIKVYVYSSSQGVKCGYSTGW